MSTHNHERIEVLKESLSTYYLERIEKLKEYFSAYKLERSKRLEGSWSTTISSKARGLRNICLKPRDLGHLLTQARRKIEEIFVNLS